MNYNYYKDRYDFIETDMRRYVMDAGNGEPVDLTNEQIFIIIYQTYNGRRSGVARRFMMDARLEFLQNLARIENLDMTITLAHRLSLALFGKSVNMDLLKAEFATKKRQADEKSKDFERFNDIVAKYKKPAEEYYQAETDKLDKIRPDTKKFMTWLKRLAAKLGNPKMVNYQD